MTDLARAHMVRPSTAFPALGLPDTGLPGTGPAPDEAQRSRTRIEIVPSRSQRRARPKIAYAAVVVTGVLAIVVTQLMLSIGLSDGAYEISSLQSQQKELDRTNQVLSEQYDALSSPQNLAASAEALGMVANSAPVYLRLSDGAVLGSPTAANGAGLSGTALIPNSLLTPAAAAAAASGAAAGASTDAATTEAAVATPSAPPVAETPADVPWQGALPSPTTR